MQIDDLVVTLALDPSDFVQKSKAARDDLSKTQAAGTKVAKATQENFSKTAEASVKSSKLMEAGAKSVTEGFGKLAETALGMFAIFGSVKAMETFVGNITHSDAAVGRLANNLGIAAKVLGGWEGAVKSVGGTAGDLDTAMQAINQARAGWEIRRDTGNDSIWNFLGISADDLKDAPGTLEKLAEAQKRLHLSNRDFSSMLGSLGIPQPVIDFLEKGPAFVKSHVAEFEKLAPSKQDTKDAQDRQAAFEKLDSTVTQIGRELLHDTTPALQAFLGVLQTIADWGLKHPDLFGAGATAAAAGAGGLSLVAIRKLLGLGGSGPVTAAEEVAVEAAGGAGAAALGVLAGLGILLIPSQGAGEGEEEELHKRGLDPRSAGSVPPGAAVSPPLSGSAGAANMKKVQDYFLAQGWAPAQVAGITANAFAESGFDPTKIGDNGTSRGLLQWHNERAQQLADWDAAHGLDPSTLEGQLAFTQWDLTQGPNKAAGDALRQQTDPTQAGMVVSQLYERPAGGDAEAYRRGQTAPMFVPQPAAPAAPVQVNVGSSGPGLHPVPPALHPDLHKLLTAATKPAQDLSHAGMVYDRAAEQWVPLSSLQPGMGGGSTVNNHDNSTTATTHVTGPISIVAPDGSAEGIAKSLKSRLASYNVVNQASTGMA